MKVDLYPTTPEQHATADDEYQVTRSNWQAFLQQTAAALEAGEPLSSMQIKAAAAALRQVGELMPEARPRPNKRPPKVPGDAAVLIAAQVVFGNVKKNQAMEYFAELWRIDEISTIEKAITRQGYSDIKRSMIENSKK